MHQIHAVMRHGEYRPSETASGPPDLPPVFHPAATGVRSRLIQVESHSDSLDDLVSHSSMTIEETRDANAALLELMAASDADHTKAIRKQCKDA